MESILSMLSIPISYISTIGLLVFCVRKFRIQPQTQGKPAVAPLHPLLRFVYFVVLAYASLATVAIFFAGFWGVVIAELLVGPISLYLLTTLVLLEYLCKYILPKLPTVPLKTLSVIPVLIVVLLFSDLLVGLVYYIPPALMEKNSKAQVSVERDIDFTEYLPSNLAGEGINDKKYQYHSYATFSFDYGPFRISENSYEHTPDLCIASGPYTCEQFGSHEEGEIFRQLNADFPNSIVYSANKRGTLIKVIARDENYRNKESIRSLIDSMSAKKPEKECSPTPLGMVGLLCRNKPRTFEDKTY